MYNLECVSVPVCKPNNTMQVKVVRFMKNIEKHISYHVNFDVEAGD